MQFPIDLIPSLIKNSSTILGGSKQKWDARRMAVAWFDQGSSWQLPIGNRDKRKKAMVSKMRVRAFRAEHGIGALEKLVEAWRKKMKQRSGFEDKLKALMQGD